jgi:hypothetical protein
MIVVVVISGMCRWWQLNLSECSRMLQRHVPYELNRYKKIMKYIVLCFVSGKFDFLSVVVGVVG